MCVSHQDLLRKLGFCEIFASYLLLAPNYRSILRKGCPKRSSRTANVTMSTHVSAFHPCSTGPHFLWGKDSGPQTWPSLPPPAPSLAVPLPAFCWCLPDPARVRGYFNPPNCACALVLSLSAFPYLAVQANIYSSFQTQLNSVLYEVFLTALTLGWFLLPFPFVTVETVPKHAAISLA